MRLDKLLSNTGYGSRKDVKALLKKGSVTVNDAQVKQPNTHVDPDNDIIIAAGQRIHYQKYVYIMMNKPKGVISATEDLRHQTIIDLLSPEYMLFNPFPVGRLDKDTEGLLLITNDGKLAHYMTSPKKDVPKTYLATIKGRIDPGDIEHFKAGVNLDDGYKTKPADLTILSRGAYSEIELTITEGKFHQVKRMFQAVDKQVIELKRIQMGDLTLDETLSPGEFRELSEHELELCLSLINQ